MRDLRDFYDPHLYATINGNRYCVKCPNAADGFKLRAIMADPELAAKTDNVEWINKLFGGTIPDDPTELPTGGLWDELAAGGVTWPEMLHLGITAIHYYGLGENIAMKYWDTAENADTKNESGETGKAPAKARNKTT